MLVEYTFRYLAADGCFSRIAQMPCDNDTDALRKAVIKMDQDYVALEISTEGRLVWRGLREDALKAVQPNQS
jgi:hypothetical protein